MFQKPLISLTFAVALAAGSISAHAQAARDFVNVVGSSTVYPFTTAVAEQFGRQGRFKTPKVESTGTGGGIKLFCNGVGPQHADVANASRRMNANEFATCQKNGVKDILEVRVGYDGLTLSESKRGPTMNLTPKTPQRKTASARSPRHWNVQTAAECSPLHGAKRAKTTSPPPRAQASF